MTKSIFDDLTNKVPHEVQEKITKSFSISDRIYKILKAKSLSQKHFAQLLDKKESEISKWLSGVHNFTLETISKIESVLNEKIIDIVHEQPADEKLFGLKIVLHNKDSLGAKITRIEQCHYFSSKDRSLSLKRSKVSRERPIEIEKYQLFSKKKNPGLSPLDEKPRPYLHRRPRRLKNNNIPL